MSAFGFDPSIILQGRSATLSDMLEPVRQMQAMRGQQATLADLMQRQQQEQQLRGIYSQSADTPDGLSAALMRGGFGQQAFQAQDQQSQMASSEAQRKKMGADLVEAARQHVRNQVAAVQSPEQYAELIKGLGPEHLTQLGLPAEYDAGKLKMYVAGGIPAAEQLKMGQQGAEFEESKRHHRAEEARPTPSILAVGPGGNQFLVDPRRPTAAAVPVLGPNGEALVKPASGAGESKDWKEFTDSVSTTRGRGNKTITDLQNRLYASERVKAAATNPDGTPKDLSPQMLTELAAATASLISQGHPAESTIHALLPKGMGMKAADMAEWLTNEPHGAGQTKFVQMMLDLANREEHVVGGQMRKAQTDRLSNYLHLRAKDPTRFNGILEGAGLDPSLLDEKGLYRLSGSETQKASDGGGDDTVMVLPPGGTKAVPVHKANLQEAIKRGGKVVTPGGVAANGG